MLLWFGEKNKGFLVLHTDSSCSVSCFKYLLQGEKGMLRPRIVWLCLLGLFWQLGAEIPASLSLGLERAAGSTAPVLWKQQSWGKVTPA